MNESNMKMHVHLIQIHYVHVGAELVKSVLNFRLLLKTFTAHKMDIKIQSNENFY